MENNLPNGWTEIELKELVSYRKGKKPKTLSPKEFKNSIPYLNIKAVEKNIIDEYADIESSNFSNGDEIFVVWDGARSGWVAKAMKGAIGSTLMAIRPYLLNTNYLFRFLQTQFDNINSNPRGTGIPHVDPEIFWNVQVPLAPLPEQQRIVEKLDALLARINNSKTRLEKIPTLLKNFRQSVLAAAVSGELTKEWREENKVEKVSSYKEFNKDAFKGNEDLPEGWSWMTVEDYLVNLDNDRVPISQELRNKRQGKYPYYGATGIIDTIDDFTHDGEFILISEDGKNLQFRNKPICFLASGKIWVNNHAHVLQAKKGFQNRYVIYFINVTDLNPYLTGIDQVKLSQKNMNGILIPVAPKEEQKEIVRKVEELFHFADSIEARYQKAKAWFDKLPQAILAKAFRGELAPQNSTDEPATVLLERIKKEKANAPLSGRRGVRGEAQKPKVRERKMYEEDDNLSMVAEE